MSDVYGGPERRRSEGNPSTEQVLEAVKKLSEQYESNSSANRALAKEVGRRKRETRWVALGVLLVVAIVVAVMFVVRHHDRAAERDKREVLAAQVMTQRESLIAGCERGNEQRRTLAEVIARAIRPSETPTTATDPEILAILEQSRQRTLQLRAELLALPGVQIINCQNAYPEPDLDR
jgi:cytoskeletal protein RodZ